MMIGQTAYPTGMPNANASSMMSPNSAGGIHTASMMNAGGVSGGLFPFNSVNQPPATKSLESSGNNPYDGSPSLRPCGSGGMSGFNMDSGSKKKRGRPRKYSPDGSIALGLTPTPISALTPAGHGDSSGTPSSEQNQSKKNRGRPPSSGRKQMDALGICFIVLEFEFFIYHGRMLIFSHIGLIGSMLNRNLGFLLSLFLSSVCGRSWRRWFYSSCDYDKCQ